MKRTIIVVSSLGTLAALAAAAWLLLPERNHFYSDADTIRAPVDRTIPRDILWQPPRPLADLVNTTEQDYEPRLSWDGLTLYYVRGKAGENADIYLSRRTPTGWTAAEPFAEINSEYDELGPEPTPDGRALYFYSDRPGGSGGYDLWMTRRIAEGWLTPTNLGPQVNSEFNDYGPAVAPDSSALYFSSNRPLASDARQPDPHAWPATVREDLFHRTYDLYTTRPSERGFTPAAPLHALNTPHSEGAPCVSPAGDFLYFASDRPGGSGGFDLYRSRLVRGEPGAVTNLGPGVNTPANELDPGLAQLGFALYFSSDRIAGDGAPAIPLDYNLYYTSSREVFPETEVTAVAIDWAALWANLWPWLLLALVLLALLLLLRAFMGTIRDRRLSLLVRCLLASLLLHMLLLLLFSVWQVANTIGDAIRRDQVQVALVSPAVTDLLTSQVRGQLTDVDAPTPQQLSDPQRDNPLDLTAPETAALLEVERTDMPAERTEAVQLNVVEAAPQQTQMPPVRTSLDRSADAQGPDLTLPPPADALAVSEVQNSPPDPRQVDDHAQRPAARFPTTQPAMAAYEIEPLRANPEGARESSESRSVLPAPLVAAESRPDDSAAQPIARHLEATDIGVAIELALPATEAPPERTETEATAHLAAAVTPAARAEIPPQQSLPADSALSFSIAPDARAPSIEPVPLPVPGAKPRERLPADVQLRTTRALLVADLAPTDSGVQLPEGSAPQPDPRDETPRTPPIAAVPDAAAPRAPLETVAPSTGPAAQVAPERLAVREDTRWPETTAPAADVQPHRVRISVPAAAAAALPQDHASDALALPSGDSPTRIVADDRSTSEASPVIPVASSTVNPRSAPVAAMPTARRPPFDVQPARTAMAAHEVASLADAGPVADVRGSPLLLPAPRPAAGSQMLPSQNDVGLRLPIETEPLEPIEAYANRSPDRRRAILEKAGGSDDTERAVDRALAWLARHQKPDGRWDSDGFDDACGDCGGQSQYQLDVALTGISTLCFLGAGHTHFEPGPYRENVARAIDWLLAQQERGGDLRQGETLYSQGAATIALAEAYGMTHDPRLATPVQRAVEFIAQARNREVGGWRYEPGQEGDTSVLGWQIMALKSAQLAGLEVPVDALDAGRDWLELVSDPSLPGLYAYRPGQAPVVSMTAEGMVVQQLLGVPRGDKRMQNAAAVILDNRPDWDAPDTYYWYFAAMALFQHGAGWPAWNTHLQRALLPSQRTDGNAAGSWDPIGAWAPIGGRVYQTAICTLTLEVYYRYLPLYSTDHGDGEVPLVNRLPEGVEAVGQLRGVVTDAGSGKPLAGVLIRLSLPEQGAVEVVTDGDGRYRMQVPLVPNHFAVTATLDGYIPASASIEKRRLSEGTAEQDFDLRPIDVAVVPIEAEPVVHHLGNDRFEGAINSQFQRDSEGRVYRAEFELTEEQVFGRSSRLAAISMLTKGVQCPHEIWINDIRIESTLRRSPRDGSFGEAVIAFPAELLRAGGNSLRIRGVSCSGDLDDFEFVNIQVHLGVGIAPED